MEKPNIEPHCILLIFRFHRSRIHTMSVPASENSKGRVEDACMLGETGIAGFSGDGDQLVFVAFNEVRLALFLMLEVLNRS